MTSDKLAQFVGAKYLNLESYRKNGTPVQTPLWFAQEGDALYVYSLASTGKVKRIRRNAQVRVAPCVFRGQPTGEWVEATASIEDAEGAARGHRLLRQKYGWQKALGDIVNRLWPRERVVMTIDLSPG
jgi:PPOX class probable F420-dependent enzyme